MPQKPIAKGVEGRRCFSRGVGDRPDGPVLPQKVGEALNTCRVGSRDALLAATPRTFAAVCSECLDGLFVDIREVSAFCFQPPAKVNG